MKAAPRRPRHPSPEEWAAAVAAGFRPNGATFAPDSILGVRIGSSNRAYEDSFLPANLHDFRYFTRTLARADADLEFFDGLRARVLGTLRLRSAPARAGWRVLGAVAAVPPVLLARLLIGRYYRAVRTVGAAFWPD